MKFPRHQAQYQALSNYQPLDNGGFGGGLAGGASGEMTGSLTREDILSAALHSDLTVDQTRQALAYLENPGTFTVSRLDDLCGDLGMAPEPGQPMGKVQAPAWLYAAVSEDLRRNGLADKTLSDDELSKFVTRAFQRHDRELAAGPEIRNVVAGLPRPRNADGLGNMPLTSKAGMGKASRYGLQNSTSGLTLRNALPDALTLEELNNLGLLEQLALASGQNLGDLPTLLSGAALGALGGIAAPVTIPAGAVALTEGSRSALLNQIEHGDPQNFEEFVERSADNLGAAGKGAVIGGVTGGMGALAAGAARAAGPVATGSVATGSVAAGAARLGTEAATMPVVAAGLEGRLPEAKDFADAAVLILGMGVAGKTAGAAIRHGKGGKSQDSAASESLASRLQVIHEQTGLTPEKLLMDAAQDPALQAELLSGRQDVPVRYMRENEPSAFVPKSPPILARPVLEKAKAGEYVDTETLVQLAGPRPWAQALLNERLGPYRLKEKLASMFDRAKRKDLSRESLAWQFVTKAEATVLSEKTGWKVEPGFTHTVTLDQLWHSIQGHAQGGEKFNRFPGQSPLTRDDIAALPEVIKPENIVEGSLSKSNTPLVIYHKPMPGGYVLYCEEVRTGKMELAFKTMYKVKK